MFSCGALGTGPAPGCGAFPFPVAFCRSRLAIRACLTPLSNVAHSPITCLLPRLATRCFLPCLVARCPMPSAAALCLLPLPAAAARCRSPLRPGRTATVDRWECTERRADRTAEGTRSECRPPAAADRSTTAAPLRRPPPPPPRCRPRPRRHHRLPSRQPQRPRGTESAPAPTSVQRAPCWPPPARPPTGVSTCCAGSGTRSSPGSRSGGERRRVLLAPSWTGSASCRMLTPAGTPGCGRRRCGSSSCVGPCHRGGRRRRCDRRRHRRDLQAPSAAVETCGRQRPGTADLTREKETRVTGEVLHLSSCCTSK